MARQVVVAAERLQRWIDGFAHRHGGAVTDVSPTEVHLTGADEAQAWLTVPFPPLPSEADLDGFVAHVTRRRRVGVLLVRRGGYAVGVFDGSDLGIDESGRLVPAAVRPTAGEPGPGRLRCGRGRRRRRRAAGRGLAGRRRHRR